MYGQHEALEAAKAAAIATLPPRRGKRAKHLTPAEFVEATYYSNRAGRKFPTPDDIDFALQSMRIERRVRGILRLRGEVGRPIVPGDYADAAAEINAEFGTMLLRAEIIAAGIVRRVDEEIKVIERRRDPTKEPTGHGLLPMVPRDSTGWHKLPEDDQEMRRDIAKRYFDELADEAEIETDDAFEMLLYADIVTPS